jgi:Calcium-activated chloride channel
MCRKRESEKERHPMEVEAEQPKYDPFSDYLEQLILYGYVSLFVVAFPLAPLLGLINNIVEIRVDIFKLLHNSSRPIARGCEDIGELSNLNDSAVVAT